MLLALLGGFVAVKIACDLWLWRSVLDGLASAYGLDFGASSHLTLVPGDVQLSDVSLRSRGGAFELRADNAEFHVRLGSLFSPKLRISTLALTGVELDIFPERHVAPALELVGHHEESSAVLGPRFPRRSVTVERGKLVMRRIVAGPLEVRGGTWVGVEGLDVEDGRVRGRFATHFADLTLGRPGDEPMLSVAGYGGLLLDPTRLASVEPSVLWHRLHGAVVARGGAVRALSFGDGVELPRGSTLRASFRDPGPPELELDVPSLQLARKGVQVSSEAAEFALIPLARDGWLLPAKLVARSGRVEFAHDGWHAVFDLSVRLSLERFALAGPSFELGPSLVSSYSAAVTSQGARKAAPRASVGIELEQARFSPARGLEAHGRLEVHGKDGATLLELGGASNELALALAALEGRPFKLGAQLTVGDGNLALRELHATSPALSAEGAFLRRGDSRFLALLVTRGRARLGLVSDVNGVRIKLNAGRPWLDRQLAGRRWH